MFFPSPFHSIRFLSLFVYAVRCMRNARVIFFFVATTYRNLFDIFKNWQIAPSAMFHTKYKEKIQNLALPKCQIYFQNFRYFLESNWGIDSSISSPNNNNNSVFQCVEESVLLPEIAWELTLTFRTANLWHKQWMPRGKKNSVKVHNSPAFDEHKIFCK